jgi:hypothetical protein
MLPAIEITLNIFWLPALCIICALGGFLLRSLQLHKLKEQVRQLEKQALQSDAEILALQKENSQIQDQLKNNPVPVIPITTKENPENLPDAAARKKLLTKSSAKQHS